MRCVIANPLTTFYMPLFFTVKGSSEQTLIVQDFNFVGKAKYILLISNFRLWIGVEWLTSQLFNFEIGYQVVSWSIS